MLGIRACPMNWPVGINGKYQGIYERETDTVHVFERSGDHGQNKLAVTSGKRTAPEIQALLSEDVLAQLEEDIELLDVAGDPFDAEKIAHGKLTPLYFGSAMTNFGVQPFLESFLKMAPRAGAASGAGGNRLAAKRGFLRFRLQNPGEHGPETSRSHRLHAYLLGTV